MLNKYVCMYVYNRLVLFINNYLLFKAKDSQSVWKKSRLTDSHQFDFGYNQI